MSRERKRILEMLSSGKLSVDEAGQLLDAVGSSGKTDADSREVDDNSKLPEFLYVAVNADSHGEKDKVNVKIPLKLLRAGIKLASVLPKDARGKVEKAMQEKGINLDFDDLNQKNVEEIVRTLKDFSVDVEGEEGVVKIYCK